MQKMVTVESTHEGCTALSAVWSVTSIFPSAVCSGHLSHIGCHCWAPSFQTLPPLTLLPSRMTSPRLILEMNFRNWLFWNLGSLLAARCEGWGGGVKCTIVVLFEGMGC